MSKEKCEYCHTEEPLVSSEDIFAYIDSDGELCIDHDEGSLSELALINYCPMCGRKLGDD